MWIPKWYLENQIRQRDDLKRRVKRLELIMLEDAENKIASLKTEETGSNESGVYDICILERKYINSKDSLVQMSFELPDRDWYELSILPCWREVESFLLKKKNKYNPSFHTMEEGLSENS